MKSEKSEDGGRPVEDLSIRPVPFTQLFRFATVWDIALLVISAVMGLCCGALQPCFALVLGNLFNSLNVKDPNVFNDKINQLSIIMTLMGVGMGTGTYFSTFCALFAAKNQSRRLREAYFSAMLRQDMSWVDTHRPGEAATRLASDTVEFQVLHSSNCFALQALP